MKDDCVIAIDIGASSGRLIACYLDENCLLHEQEIYRFENNFILEQDSYIWDVEKIFNNILIGLKKNKHLTIKSLGVDTWGVDYVLVDRDGNLLDKVYAYRDSRTNDVYSTVVAEIGKEKIYKITGIQFMPINTLYQLKAHRKVNPNVFTDTSCFLMIPDYLHYRLCKKFCNEFTQASTSQCVNHQTKQFDEQILQYLEVPKSIFPPMVRAGTILGSLDDSVQNSIGVEGDIKVVVPGTHDTASALAAFIGDEKTAFISSGTWSVMGAETTTPITSDTAMSYNFSNEGGVYNTNRLLKNTMGMWIINCVLSEMKTKLSFMEVVREAQKAKSFRTIIDPDNKSFLNPPSMVEAIQNYAKKTQQVIPISVGEIARCVYESLALRYNKTLLELEEVTGIKYININIIGGGSKNDFLNQLTSNITQCNVIAGPVETSSLGNAVVQMIALGWIKNLQEARKIIRESEKVLTYKAQKNNAQEMVVFFNSLCCLDV